MPRITREILEKSKHRVKKDTSRNEVPENDAIDSEFSQQIRYRSWGILGNKKPLSLIEDSVTEQSDKEVRVNTNITHAQDNKSETPPIKQRENQNIEDNKDTTRIHLDHKNEPSQSHNINNFLLYKTQLDHNKDTYRSHINLGPTIEPQQGHNKNTIRSQQGHYPGHNKNTIRSQHKDTNRSQIDHNNIIKNGKSEYSLLMELTGIQKQIAFFIIDTCLSKGTLSTPQIPFNSFIGVHPQSSPGSVKTSLRRLEDKRVVIRDNGKRGRGGFYVFSISEQIRNAYLIIIKGSNRSHIDHISGTIGSQQGHHPGHNKDTIQVTTQPSSSSIYINKNTTTVDPSGDLSTDWQSIDIFPLDSIKFTIHHITQIFLQNKLTPEQVQESINAFAFDLKNNKRQFKTGPLNFFMGILKSGQIYNPPENYESPRDRSLRIFLENQKNRKQERVTLEKEAFELAFENWKSELTLDKMAELLEIKKDYLKPGKLMDSQLSAHFSQSIWPIIRKESGF